MIRLNIDGRDLAAKKGETVLELCRRSGIHVPTLCFQENLKPYGGCRLCIVEVRGWSRPLAACTLPAEEGMVILTDTPDLRAERRSALQLILSEHPHACLVCGKKDECGKFMECIEKEPITFGCKYCAKNGDCELQRLVEELGVDGIPYRFSYRNVRIEDDDPFFIRDYNLCILCGRCVRACEELRCASVIDFHHRGPKTLVGTAYGRSHLDADCQFCGACVDACPTGAMSERSSRWFGCPDHAVASACPLCSIGCEISLNVKDRRLISAEPRANELCARGRFGLVPLVNHPRRITAPLMKKEHGFVEVDWNEALEFAASRISEAGSRTGIVFSPQITCEAIDAISCLAEMVPTEYYGVLDADPEARPVKIDPAGRKAAVIAVATDIIDDLSVLLLKLKAQLPERPLVIAIDAVRNNSWRIADLAFTVKPGQVSEFLDVLLNRRIEKDCAGVKKQEIIDAKKALAARDVYLIYNPANVRVDPAPGKTGGVIRINGLPNMVKCTEMLAGWDLVRSEKNPCDCLYLVGEAPKLASRPRTLIVQDCFRPGFDFDLFLPAAMSPEIDGTFIDYQGKQQRLAKAVEPAGQARPDAWIVKEITSRLACSMTGGKRAKRRPRAVLSKSGVRPGKEYPYYLVVKDNLYRFRSTPLSAVHTGFRRMRADDRLWMSPDDAARLNLKDGQEVKIRSREWSTAIRVKVDAGVRGGTLLAWRNFSLGITGDTAVRIDV